MPAMTQYVTLKLGETKSGNAKTLHALRSTADYYGWTKEFPEWIGKPLAVGDRYELLHSPSRRGHPQSSSGRRMRISRSASRDGNPAGFTNAFKVSANTGLLELAELAHFTKVDWEWMTSTDHSRVSRADWEHRYARDFH